MQLDSFKQNGVRFSLDMVGIFSWKYACMYVYIYVIKKYTFFFKYMYM